MLAAQPQCMHWSLPDWGLMQFLGYFLGIYFAIGAFADLFTLGSVTVSTYQFTTNTKAFMEAVQEVRTGHLCLFSRPGLTAPAAGLG